MANTKIGVSRTAIVLIDFIQSHPFVKFLFIGEFIVALKSTIIKGF